MRFGLIGTGYWAREVHGASVASHPDASLVGVWGRDPAKAASVGDAFGAEAYTDLDAMLDAVDAVTFSVPPSAGGLGDLVDLVPTHESGATSTLRLSLTMPPDMTRSGLEFYRADGWHARPDSPFDALGAHRAAVADLVSAASTGQTRHRCDVWFGRDVVAMTLAPSRRSSQGDSPCQRSRCPSTN